jgi:hypothetical protein
VLLQERVNFQYTNKETAEFAECHAARNMEIIETRYMPTLESERELYVE